MLSPFDLSFLFFILGAAFIVWEILVRYERWSSKKSGVPIVSDEVLKKYEDKIKENKFVFWYKFIKLIEIIYMKRILLKLGLVLLVIGVLLYVFK